MSLLKINMAKEIHIGEITDNQEISENCFLMKVILPVSFIRPSPGQFVMVRIAGLVEPFLGRPISIYSFTGGISSCTMELLYRVIGRGTEILAGLIRGSQLEVHGPLGGGFEIFPDKKKIVFIAGGIGVAPLSLLAEHLCNNVHWPREAMTFYLGAQSKTAIMGLDKLGTLCYDIRICTDDGTRGQKSLVTDIFQKDIKKYSPADTALYACGPKGMMQTLARMLKASRFICQISLEERMACGTGACMGCAVAVKSDNGSLAYKRVCSDGPVFNINDVVWPSDL
jgi:dihydroorotate dehydrogenase electron transfer subunit